jgi:hypothetical protein
VKSEEIKPKIKKIPLERKKQLRSQNEKAKGLECE